MNIATRLTGRSFRNWKYFLNLIPIILTIYGNLTGGWLTLLNFIFSFVLLGIAEIILPEDRTNDDIVEDNLPDILMSLSLAAQIFALLSLIYGISSGLISAYWIIAAAISTGASSGTLAIVVAHELIHRKNKVWNFAGRFLLFSVFNPYFYIHHLRIHHKFVGTGTDPVTARYGESYYHYVVRSISGQLKQSAQLEKLRCASNGFSVFGYHNYIEHYGLSRPENERVNERHSWQSDKVISRFLLIDLSRHSDHHFHASKPFNQLASYPESPVLPGGYASMLLPALIPPLWFSLVNKRIPADLSTGS